MTMITPSYLGETIEYSSLHACRSTLEDPTPDRLAAQLGKNMPFVGEMLIDHGVRIADLFSDLAKRHGLVAAIGKHFAGSRKDFAPQPLLALYPATW